MDLPETQAATPNATRKRRMGVLARCAMPALKACWDALGLDPACHVLRKPQTGLLMLRGRIGGTGELFNIGEATVTRATVQLEDGTLGHAMALGSDPVRAQLAAVIDALGETDAHAARIESEIIAPLERALAEQDALLRTEIAATKVDFFTVARGED